jgi:hypothetical protein
MGLGTRGVVHFAPPLGRRAPSTLAGVEDGSMPTGSDATCTFGRLEQRRPIHSYEQCSGARPSGCSITATPLEINGVKNLPEFAGEKLAPGGSIAHQSRIGGSHGKPWPAAARRCGSGGWAVSQKSVAIGKWPQAGLNGGVFAKCLAAARRWGAAAATAGARRVSAERHPPHRWRRTDPRANAPADQRGSRIKDQGSRVKDQGSRIKDQGSRIKDQGSRIRSVPLRN